MFCTDFTYMKSISISKTNKIKYVRDIILNIYLHILFLPLQSIFSCDNMLVIIMLFIVSLHHCVHFLHYSRAFYQSIAQLFHLIRKGIFLKPFRLLLLFHWVQQMHIAALGLFSHYCVFISILSKDVYWMFILNHFRQLRPLSLHWLLCYPLGHAPPREPLYSFLTVLLSSILRTWSRRFNFCTLMKEVKKRSSHNAYNSLFFLCHYSSFSYVRPRVCFVNLSNFVSNLSSISITGLLRVKIPLPYTTTGLIKILYKLNFVDLLATLQNCIQG